MLWFLQESNLVPEPDWHSDLPGVRAVPTAGCHTSQDCGPLRTVPKAMADRTQRQSCYVMGHCMGLRTHMELSRGLKMGSSKFWKWFRWGEPSSLPSKALVLLLMLLSSPPHLRHTARTLHGQETTFSVLKVKARKWHASFCAHCAPQTDGGE